MSRRALSPPARRARTPRPARWRRSCTPSGRFRFSRASVPSPPVVRLAPPRSRRAPPFGARPSAAPPSAPASRAARPARRHPSSPRLARAGPDDPGDSAEDWEALFANLKPQAPKLPAYKVAVLEEALARGRRQVPVRDVAADLELTRDDVLAWLKANAHRQPELAKKYPAAAPPPEMVASVPIGRADGRDYDNVRDNRRRDSDDSATDDAYDPQTAYLRNARTGTRVPKGMPAWKGYKKSRLGARNVATLEKVYAADRFPSDEMVDSVHARRSSPEQDRRVVQTNARRRRRRQERSAEGEVRGRGRGRGLAPRGGDARGEREGRVPRGERARPRLGVDAREERVTTNKPDTVQV